MASKVWDNFFYQFPNFNGSTIEVWEWISNLIPHSFNSLAPGKFEWNFRYVIFKQISMIDYWGISCEIALIWMSLDFSDGLSTLVQVMAWCRQATSHYMSQCWPRSLSPYGVTRPQWVNGYNYLSMLGFKLIHISQRCPRRLILLVLKSEYSRTLSIRWQLMTRLPALPVYQQPQYWFYVMNGSLSSMRKDFNYLHLLNIAE